MNVDEAMRNPPGASPQQRTALCARDGAQAASSRALASWGGMLLGIGLGGFFDGIVFHQLRQWHHLLSSVTADPVTTVTGLQVNTFWDGVFHAGTYLVTAAGLVLLWRVARVVPTSWPGRWLAGLSLLGWGCFNLVEGLIDHELLGVHHVNETVLRRQRVWWDLAFLVWGAAMLLIGWRLIQARPPTPAES
jgi:uncharacterized membrane protein